ncbi:ribosome rescue protein RqcH [Methanosarcina mazei]|jgi:predicted ribosome quality control (RQC) complex YloA/Tae2 family protein|uniref:Archaeal Rqc2 homolog aRqcH n=7 Tax=Methanosarcina mazei TaxID=2209 RepID=A0A0F8MT60_METMZ|nr:ribosome rescue protein RqcH [Methanosarcina mazei]KKG17380.1 fibronectin-binding protein [Methanosarcina mazei]KKG28175.1 fibronectin-binding protein [Methanosarcina mazei]KKG40722.1 fibronectin-binding protein [Methanosarcina mazei]KKG41192.1 fibronectin-binding protein [Methanosarcina mazei]KKG41788.1 fibronectin-binding protein [Methanosarcina mazei]
MKQDMSSADVAAVVAELSAGPRSIIDAKIGKIYQPASEEIRINLYVFHQGRDNLVIEAGKRLHMTKHIRPSPTLPQAFPMLLRKYLMGGRIVSVEQHDFDRIVKIGIERAGVRSTLIVELFARGNVLIVDSENKIILPMNPVTLKDRRLRSGEIYELPEAQLSPIEAKVSDLMDAFSKSTADIVRTIATRFNLGGVLAEEACARAGINKSRPAKEATVEDAEKLREALQDLFSPLFRARDAARTEGEPEGGAEIEDRPGAETGPLIPGLRPQHIKQEINGKMETFDVVPFDLNRYSEYEKEYFDSFNTALDEFFGKKALEQVAEVKEAEKKEKTLGVFERRLMQQEESLAKFEKEIEKNNALAETVYANYQIIEELFSVLNGARAKGYSWDEIRSILKQAKKTVPAAQTITNIDQKTGTVTVNLDGKSINLDIRKTVPQNAQEYYEKVKKFTKKKDGAIRAIEDTKKAMEKKAATKSAKAGRKLQASRKKHWYDRFRWFVSSDGFLVVGGRDADTNEEIFKKYMEKRDIVFHTQTPGAPLTVVKTGGKEVPDSTLQEVSQFAVSYSSLWKAGQFSGDCYWIKSEQVTKTPESGEYLKKGAFVIRGERNYFKDVPLGIAVGLELKGETRIIGGPASAVRKHGDYILEIIPGKFNQNDISKKIYRIYADELNDPRFVKQIASPDQIAMMIPAGESDLRNQKPEKKGQGFGPEGEGYETPEMEAGFEDLKGEIDEESGENAGEEFADEEFAEEIGEGSEVKVKAEAREGNEEIIEIRGVKKE